ncbi:hypothetical protein ACFY2W_10615 [Streptomyces sp. NPDC001262]|uniref:hypothetical protein n=1 Tax=Streptomyces sp. NPDC001262 TaxID=3364552 RepID=UPI0036A3991F
MTTQAAQTTTAPVPVGQGSHMYLLTLDKPGQVSGSWHGTWTPPPGATRHDVLVQFTKEIEEEDPRFVGATIAFFSLEPNQL